MTFTAFAVGRVLFFSLHCRSLEKRFRLFLNERKRGGMRSSRPFFEARVFQSAIERRPSASLASGSRSNRPANGILAMVASLPRPRFVFLFLFFVTRVPGADGTLSDGPTTTAPPPLETKPFPIFREEETISGERTPDSAWRN